jgi:hypothetical protein
MKRLLFGLMLFSAVAVLSIATGVAQPPDGGRPGKRDRGDGKGPPGGPGGPGGGPPRFELGKVLPPFVREELELSQDQEEQIAALEKQVKAKLEKILSAEQRRKIRSIRPPMPPGADGDGPPDGPPDRRLESRPEGRPNGRKGGRPDGPPPGQDRPGKQGDDQASAGGIQWFTTWEAGKQEAARTGKPILLVSAAPHCAGVSGIW